MNGKLAALGFIGFFVILIVLVLCFGSWGTINAGNRGVVLRMGAVTNEIKGEGFYTKTPWFESVVQMNVQQQKEQVETGCASKDLQTIHAVIALNLSLDPAKCAEVYQTIGVNYLDKIVAPSMQEAVKAIMAKYTAEELITKREQVRQDMYHLVQEKLTPVGIKTEALNIVNLDFSKAFNEAIELKVTAEQNALASKNLLDQKKYEAQQAVEVAKGKAEAMSIESAALAKNPNILSLRALEKWNGVLPTVTSGTIPFINVDSVK